MKYLLFFEAVLLSFYYHMRLLVIKQSNFGAVMTESFQKYPENQLIPIRECIRRSNKFLPGKSRCLINALTAKSMLNRRHFVCTLYLGVKKTDSGSLQAHAWLRCGEYIVSGFCNFDEYTVVSTFT